MKVGKSGECVGMVNRDELQKFPKNLILNVNNREH